MPRIGTLGVFAQLPPAAEAVWAGDVTRCADVLAGRVDEAVTLGPGVSATPITLAIIGRRTAVVDWLLTVGVDLNAAAEPAFLTAARYGEPDLLRQLASAGADVHARVEPGGDAFAQAWHGKRTANLPVIDELGHRVADHGGPLFRSPAHLHSREHGLDLLRDHDAPAELTAFLDRGERIDAPDSALGWVDLLTVPDLFEFRACGQRVLRLSRTSADFEHVHLVWDGRSQRVCWWDEEHQELGVMGTWDAFGQDPAARLADLDI